MPPTQNELLLLEYLHLKNTHHQKRRTVSKLPHKMRQHELDKIKKSLVPFETKFRKVLFDTQSSRSEMVIAHYRENLEWALQYRKWATVYHKGGQQPKETPELPRQIDHSHFRYHELPNVGREGHTYLYYIVSRWNSLPENVFFTQGSCSVDHRPFPIESYLMTKPNISLYMNVWNRGIEFDDYPGGTLRHIGKWKRERDTGVMSPSPTSFIDWWKEYISPVFPIDGSLEKVFRKWKWSHGAIFSVSRDCIKQHPLIFYQKLLTNLQRHVNPEEGHFLEKSWFYIFDRDSQKKMYSKVCPLK